MKLSAQTNQSVQFADDVSASPAIPTAGNGADLEPLKSGGGSYEHALILLDRASGGPVTLTGPVLFGGELDGKIYNLGKLNDGDDIVVAATDGFSAVVRFVGIYDRFWLRSAAVGGGGYDGFIQGVEDTR